MEGIVMEIVFQGRRPVRQHEDDAGADLTAAETVLIPAGGFAVVGTGTRVQLPTGTVGVVASRSGMHAEPWTSTHGTVRRACRVRKAEGRQVPVWRRAGGVCDRCGIDATGRWPDVLGLVCRDCRDVLTPEVAA